MWVSSSATTPTCCTTIIVTTSFELNGFKIPGAPSGISTRPLNSIQAGAIISDWNNNASGRGGAVLLFQSFLMALA